MADPITGATVQLGSETVTLLYPHRALRAAFSRFKGRDLDKLLEDCRKLDFDTVTGLAACGLIHLKIWSEDKISDVLDLNPDQNIPLAAAVLEAFSIGYARTIGREARNAVTKAGEQSAAAMRLLQTQSAEGSGPTSTPPSAPASGSDSTQT